MTVVFPLGPILMSVQTFERCFVLAEIPGAFCDYLPGARTRRFDKYGCLREPNGPPRPHFSSKLRTEATGAEEPMRQTVRAQILRLNSHIPVIQRPSSNAMSQQIGMTML